MPTIAAGSSDFVTIPAGGKLSVSGFGNAYIASGPYANTIIPLVNNSVVGPYSVSTTVSLVGTTALDYTVTPLAYNAQSAITDSRLASTLNFPFDGSALPAFAIGSCGVIAAYRGPLYTIRREADGATFDVSAKPSAVDRQPSKTDILAWLGNDIATVQTVYDQVTGTAITQSQISLQPVLNMDGDYPVWDFDGVDDYFDLTSFLATFFQSKAAISAVIARRNDSTAAIDGPLVFCSGNTASSVMAWIGPKFTTNGDTVGMRAASGTAAFDTTLSPNINSEVDITRFDPANGRIKRNRGGQSSNIAQNTGTSTAADSGAAVNIGRYVGTPGLAYNGKVMAIALFSRALSDQEVSNQLTQTASRALAPAFPDQFLRWNSGPMSSAPTSGNAVGMSLVPGTTIGNVIVPNGNTPVAGDPSTHQYHHHTQVARKTPGGRLWVAASSALTGEDQPGQNIVLSTSTDDGATWTAPFVGLPSQDTMTTGTGGIILWTRCFAFDQSGKMYIVGAIQNPDRTIGLGLIAAECKDDGTVGSPFSITTDPYTPAGGITPIPYNATLAAQLFNYSNVFGVWGGSTPNASQMSSFVGTVSQTGLTDASKALCIEMATFPIDNTGQRLQRLWRKIPAGNVANNGVAHGFAYSQLSSDGGKTFGKLKLTDIPNIAVPAAMRLPDGRFVLVANTMVNNRTSIYVATFDASGNRLTSQAIAQGAPASPVYAGPGKSGGYAYPGLYFDASLNTLYVSYSAAKENVVLAKIPLASLS